MTKKKNTQKNESNVSERERENLRQQNIHGDGGDDQQLRDRQKDVDFTGKGMDVPEPKTQKKTGNEQVDEENKLYSEGGEHNENLERDDSAR